MGARARLDFGVRKGQFAEVDEAVLVLVQEVLTHKTYRLAYGHTHNDAAQAGGGKTAVEASLRW